MSTPPLKDGWVVWSIERDDGEYLLKVYKLPGSLPLATTFWVVVGLGVDENDDNKQKTKRLAEGPCADFIEGQECAETALEEIKLAGAWSMPR